MIDQYLFEEIKKELNEYNIELLDSCFTEENAEKILHKIYETIAYLEIKPDSYAPLQKLIVLRDKLENELRKQYDDNIDNQNKKYEELKNDKSKSQDVDTPINIIKNNEKENKRSDLSKRINLINGCLAVILAFICLCVLVSDNVNKLPKTNVDLPMDNNTDETINIPSTNANSNVNTILDGSTYITDVSDVVKNAMPSIVAITSTTNVDMSNYYFFFGGTTNSYEAQGAGSGVIIKQTDSELLILTNNHVIADVDSISIQFCDGETVDANIKGTDSKSDLAIVSVPIKNIKTTTLKSIRIATLGNSTLSEVGDGVIAIGNALGYGQSVTTGIISALNREITRDDGTKQTMIQTDASINSGNSGGALINSNGEVIGINAAKYSSNGMSATVEGMGFAIPISSSTEIINKLINQETKEKVDEDKQGTLGIQCTDISAAEAQRFGFPNGVYVTAIQTNSKADDAGLVAGDIIIAINETTVTTSSELKKQLQYYAIGEKVKLTIAYETDNGYKNREITVELVKQAEK